MSTQLAVLFWLLAMPVGVFLITRPVALRRWRRKLLWIAAIVWLVSACVLIADVFEKRPFFIAIMSGDTARVRELLVDKPSRIRAKSFMGETVLHLAVKSSNSEMVAFLIKSGVDVNATDASKITPLDCAAFEGNELIAEMLIKAGANVNAVGGRHDDTPLHIAAFHGHVSVVKLLLAHGATLNARNMLRQTPLQLAEETQQTNVIAVLTSANTSQRPSVKGPGVSP